jgi:hypothetical protein
MSPPAAVAQAETIATAATAANSFSVRVMA